MQPHRPQRSTALSLMHHLAFAGQGSRKVGGGNLIRSQTGRSGVIIPATVKL